MGYPLRPLRECLKHRKEFITLDDLQEYKRCRVQLRGQGVVLRDIVPGAEIKTKTQQVCRAGELLVAEIDAKLGGFGIVPDDLDGAMVSSHYFLFEIEESVLDRAYLSFYLKTSAFLDQVNAKGTTNYAAIRPRDVLAYTIPLPPLDEQRRVVEKLEGLSRRLGEAELLSSEVDEGCSTLVVSLHLTLSDCEIRLGECLHLDEEKVPISPDREYPQAGVRAYGRGLFTTTPLVGTATTYRYLNRLKEGSLVLSQVKGWEGAVAVVTAEMDGRFVSPEYRTFRCEANRLLPRYMANLLQTPWFYGRLAPASRGVGARRERVRPELFLNLPLPMPGLEKQKQALGVFERLAGARELAAEARRARAALSHSALTRIF